MARSLTITLATTLCLGLAGCGQSLPDSGGVGAVSKPGLGFAALFDRPAADTSAIGQESRPQMPRPLARVRLMGGDLVVEPPRGYCIDPVTAQTRGQRGFAAIASCRILSGGAVGSTVAPMVATVAVGPRADADALPTAAALAQASGAALLGSKATPDLVIAHLASGGRAGLAGGDERYWRGAFVHAGRLIGLALYAPKGSALAAEQGGAMLATVRANIVANSPGTGSAPTLSGGTGAVKPARPGVGRLLDRLFNR